VQELNSNIVLLGYSGHAYVVAEAALLLKINIKGYASDTMLNFNPYKLDYLGSERGTGFDELNHNTFSSVSSYEKINMCIY